MNTTQRITEVIIRVIVANGGTHGTWDNEAVLPGGHLSITHDGDQALITYTGAFEQATRTARPTLTDMTREAKGLVRAVDGHEQLVKRIRQFTGGRVTYSESQEGAFTLTRDGASVRYSSLPGLNRVIWSSADDVQTELATCPEAAGLLAYQIARKIAPNRWVPQINQMTTKGGKAYISNNPPRRRDQKWYIVTLRNNIVRVSKRGKTIFTRRYTNPDTLNEAITAAKVAFDDEMKKN